MRWPYPTTGHAASLSNDRQGAGHRRRNRPSRVVSCSPWDLHPSASPLPQASVQRRVGAWPLDWLMTDEAVPLQDPTPHLSPTAERLLEAARLILKRDGFDHLTYEAIAAESGETQSLIRYHFKSKSGLIRTLIESEFYLESRDVMDAVSSASPGAERRHALLRKCQEMVLATDEYRAYFELLPHIARNEELRPVFRALVEWYIRLNAWSLAPDPDARCLDDLEPLATLAYAVADGMALRLQADPEVDIGPTFRLWETMVDQYMATWARDRREANDM